MLTCPAVDEAIVQLIDDLGRARDMIATRGLDKGAFCGWDGSLCTVGALRQVVGYSSTALSRVQRAVLALSSTLGSGGQTHTSRCIDVFRFNDNPLTTKDDVIGLFNTAISRLGR